MISWGLDAFDKCERIPIQQHYGDALHTGIPHSAAIKSIVALTRSSAGILMYGLACKGAKLALLISNQTNLIH